MLPTCPPDQPAIFSAQHLKHAVADLLPPGVVVAGDPATDAVVGCQLVGGGLMVVAALAPHTVVRHQRQHLAHVAADDINVAMMVEGSARVELPGQAIALERGAILFLPASCPSTLHAGAACRMLILRLSFRRFSNGQGGRFSDFRVALAQHDSPLRMAVFSYVEHVLPSLGDSALATVAHAEQAFIALLAAVHAEASNAATAPGQNRWEQLVLAIDAGLHDADLDVPTLAAALAITPRHVHRLFAGQGLRYGPYLLEQRLARARDDLRRPMLLHLGVAQIGYRAGFNSASHFSRSFRQRYGVAPLAWRSMAG
jgi:AraC-like DNA-binding protein